MRSGRRPEYLLVHYEKLVSHPERELARIRGHLGEDYVPAILEPAPHSDPLADRTKLASKPVTPERLGRWRVELTADEVALVEWIAGEMMEVYGYQRSAPPPSGMAIARGLGAAAWDTCCRRLPQIPGIWYYLMRPTQLAKEEFWVHGRRRRQVLNEPDSTSATSRS
jgi:hypothetical protein